MRGSEPRLHYVVKFSLGIQPAVWGSCDGRTDEMFGEVAMAELWDGVGKAVTAGTHKAQEWASGWVRCSHWR
jgi:hypothetical protein